MRSSWWLKSSWICGEPQSSADAALSLFSQSKPKKTLIRCAVMSHIKPREPSDDSTCFSSSDEKEKNTTNQEEEREREGATRPISISVDFDTYQPSYLLSALSADTATARRFSVDSHTLSAKILFQRLQKSVCRLMFTSAGAGDRFTLTHGPEECVCAATIQQRNHSSDATLTERTRRTERSVLKPGGACPSSQAFSTFRSSLRYEEPFQINTSSPRPAPACPDSPGSQRVNKCSREL
ncbi:hypothetical protein DNTS_020580 [Danionella cerebrum]|uniref:Uncharacterized protein n=1 Tax=Danionella cerebrum TaxID=2873325 RepID=A0A553R531_9TELE|nr:hypothetical protein DNTS_020580 [Danionella translucida]